MEKKMTKKEMFSMIKEVAGIKENADMVAFIDHEIELLNKSRSGKKPSAKQLENEDIMVTIKEVLRNSESALQVSELLKTDELKEFTNQKLSALLKKLVDRNEVVRNAKGKKVTFELVTTDLEEIGE